MERSVVFTRPIGEDVIDPECEHIGRLLDEGDSYWTAGSGDAGLRFCRNGKTLAEMILIVREGLGVFLHHLFNEEAEAYVLSRPECGPEEVTIKHAGDPWSLPKAFFVGKEEAMKAIGQFLDDGGRVKDAHWVKF